MLLMVNVYGIATTQYCCIVALRYASFTIRTGPSVDRGPAPCLQPHSTRLPQLCVLAAVKYPFAIPEPAPGTNLVHRDFRRSALQPSGGEHGRLLGASNSCEHVSGLKRDRYVHWRLFRQPVSDRGHLPERRRWPFSDEASRWRAG